MGALFKVFKSDGITEIANIKSVAFREAVNTGEHLTPGCVSSAGIEVEVFNTQANAVSAGDVVYAYVYDNANNGTLLGKFNCEPRIDTKNSYKFTAYDNALKLEADFSQWLQANQSNFPYTIKQLVQQACTIAGVTLGSSSWPLSLQRVQAFYADGLTCRDILSYAAELAGRFVRCHTDGKIYFDWYATNANSIAPSAGTGIYAYKQDGLTYANYTTTALARVAVHPSGEDDVAYIYPTGVTSGNTLHIKNNLLLTGADASFYNAAAQQVYTAVTAVGSYCPMSVNLFPRENPFRAGDIVSITDAQSVTISAPVMSVTISNAAATLVSDGRENYEDTTETAKAITQLASDVVRINKLKVDWADINTAIVNYLTANNVTAQNLTIVDEYGNVLATYDANGITLGQAGETHAEIDFNSFSLIDKDGTTYLSVGDMRDVNGEVSVTLGYIGDGTTTEYTIDPVIVSSYRNTISVTVGGVIVSNYQLDISGSFITFNSAPSANSVIEITYITNRRFYRYDLGVRKSGSNIGSYSAVFGQNSEATAAASLSGGYNNSANGICSVAFGQQNEVNGSHSFACGVGNKANGRSSFVGAGESNKANGACSFVGSGRVNSANGSYAFVVGGDHNNADGFASSIVGGSYNNANHRSQVVFGEYNEADPSANAANQRGNYVEIVGKGTSDNARSNARTLDWNGNEVLAGGLTINGNRDVGAELNGKVSKTGDTMTGNLIVQKSGEALVMASSNTTYANVQLNSYTDGRHGIYSNGYYDGTFHTGGKWLIYRNSSGNVIVNGRATDDFNLTLGTNIPDNSDLNDYKTVGTYYVASSTNAATITNSPATGAGYKLVVAAQGSILNLKQIIFVNSSTNIYIRYYNGSTWGAWRLSYTSGNVIGISSGGTGATSAADARKNLGLCYAVNDTLSFGTYYLTLPGFVASNTTTARLDVMTPKSLEDISSVTVIEMKGRFYGPNGLVDSRASDVDYTTLSGHTVTATKLQTADSVSNRIRITVTKSTAYTNVANFAPVTYFGTLKLKFT